MNSWQKIRSLLTRNADRAMFHLKTIRSSKKLLNRWASGIYLGTFGLTIYINFDSLKKLITERVGQIADTQIPQPLRYSIFNLYSKCYGVNLEEVELPLKNYTTFGEFFTRKIVRKQVDTEVNTLLSPCDGKILSFCQVTSDSVHIIKGISYSLSQLVLSQSKEFIKQPINNFLKKDKNNTLYQVIIYLAPGDYHRFHSPASIKILKKSLIPGLYDSVSQKALVNNKVKYEKNVRVTLFTQWAQGLLTMVMVGALNVSRIHINNAVQLKPKEQLGYFNLGSTIVLIVQSKGAVWKIQEGQKIKYGQPLFEYLL